jgi:RNA polymerase sigma factor (sigma-70 family)
MPEPDDITLLKQYAGGDESAFTAVFERHVNLVYTAALRQARNPSQAEEVTQAVFILLAQKAKSLSPKTVLSGWLYQAARLTTASLIKREIRRQRREQEVYMQSLTEPDSPLWEQISPLLDEAMGRLGENDRNAIVLRYFENKTPQEAAAALNLKEVTARKRVSRALEKLQKLFSKRGIASTAETLAGAISIHSVQPAPVALVKALAAAGLAKGAAASLPALALAKSTAMALTMKTKIIVAPPSLAPSFSGRVVPASMSICTTNSTALLSRRSCP